MKILLASPHADLARAWAAALPRSEPDLDVSVQVRPLRDLTLPAAGPGPRVGDRPDLVIAALEDEADLQAVERLAAQPGDPEWVLVAPAPGPDLLLRLMRCGVREVLAAPGAPADLRAAVTRVAGRRASAPETVAPRGGEVIGFLSCKGGSGSTFVATNLAHVLADGGQRRVAVLDLNLQFGDAALFVTNQRPQSDVAELARNIHRLDRALLQAAMVQASPGLFVLAASDDPAHAADVTAGDIEAILALARTMFDVVIVDAGRSLNAVTLKALDACERIYVVLQLTLPFIRDGRRLRDMLDSLGYPPSRVHWIVNRYQKGGDISLEDLSRTLGVAGVLTLPNQYDVVAASVNQGVPVDRLAPGSAISRALRELAATIVPPAGKQRQKGWLPGLFGRAVRQEGVA